MIVLLYSPWPIQTDNTVVAEMGNIPKFLKPAGWMFRCWCGSAKSCTRQCRGQRDGFGHTQRGCGCRPGVEELQDTWNGTTSGQHIGRHLDAHCFERLYIVVLHMHACIDCMTCICHGLAENFHLEVFMVCSVLSLGVGSWQAKHWHLQPICIVENIFAHVYIDGYTHKYVQSYYVTS